MVQQDCLAPNNENLQANCLGENLMYFCGLDMDRNLTNLTREDSFLGISLKKY